MKKILPPYSNRIRFVKFCFQKTWADVDNLKTKACYDEKTSFISDSKKTDGNKTTTLLDIWRGFIFRYVVFIRDKLSQFFALNVVFAYLYICFCMIVFFSSLYHYFQELLRSIGEFDLVYLFELNHIGGNEGLLHTLLVQLDRPGVHEIHQSLKTTNRGVRRVILFFFMQFFLFSYISFSFMPKIT